MAPPCITRLIYGPDVLDWDDPAKIDSHVQFPVNQKSDLRIQIIYAMDGTTVKWYEHLMTAEAVIYDQTETLDIEAEVARIKTILTTPGLQLNVAAVGLGTIPIINVSHMDPCNGPLPQEVVVTPFGANNAIYIKWTVKFHLSTCPSIGVGRILNMASRLSMDLDEDGDVTLAAEGEIEYEQSLNQQALPTILAILNQDADSDPDTPTIIRGYTWRLTTHLEPNGRTVKFRGQAIPIKSENAFFVDTRMVDITQELSSSLLGKSMWDGKGFYTWKNTFSGDITLPPGVHKSWAWSVFLRVLRQRNRRLLMAGNEKLAAIIEGTVAADATTNAPYMIPLKMKFKEKIYGRTLSFNIDYMVVCSLDRILTSTGLFQRVNNDYPANDSLMEDYEPADLSTQWQEWQENYLGTQNPMQFRYGPLPIQFDCGNTFDPPSVTRRGQIASDDDPDYSVAPEDDEYEYDETVLPKSKQVEDNSDKRVTWSQYDQNFFIYENTKTLPVNYLSAGQQSHYKVNQSNAATVGNNSEGWNLQSTGAAHNQNAVRGVSYRGPSNYVIRMQGHAIRMKYPIPMPTIVSVAGGDAIRTGQPKWMHKQISQSSDYPVYFAAWDVSYILTTELQGNILEQLISNGYPGQFV